MPNFGLWRIRCQYRLKLSYLNNGANITQKMGFLDFGANLTLNHSMIMNNELPILRKLFSQFGCYKCKIRRVNASTKNDQSLAQA